MTMNPQISRSLADEHISELRRQAAQYAAAAHRDRDRRAPRLRRRIGLVMIEAAGYVLRAREPGRSGHHLRACWFVDAISRTAPDLADLRGPRCMNPSFCVRLCRRFDGGKGSGHWCG